MMQRPEIKELSNIQIFKPQSTTLDNGIDMKINKHRRPASVEA